MRQFVRANSYKVPQNLGGIRFTAGGVNQLHNTDTLCVRLLIGTASEELSADIPGVKLRGCLGRRSVLSWLKRHYSSPMARCLRPADVSTG